MKFVRVITKHTREAIDSIVEQLNPFYKEMLTKLYQEFKQVEFITENGFVAMYAAIDEGQLKRLFEEYVKCEINFSYEDITKTVLFGNIPEITGEPERKYLITIIEEFKEENLDTDTVLEKISELGMHRLTEQDKKVLHEH